MIDTTDLIGLPFEYNARGPGAYDCWGLVRVCYRRWHDVELPDYPSSRSPRQNDDTVNAALAGDWKRALSAIPGSVLVLRVNQFGAHVGFVLSPTRMIHALQGVGVVIVPTSTYKNQILGAYHYVA